MRPTGAMIRFLLLAAILLLVPTPGVAQTTVTLPDTSQDTTLTASVSEQTR